MKGRPGHKSVRIRTGLGLRPDRKTLSRRLLERRLAACMRAVAAHGFPTDLSGELVCLDLGGVGRYRSWFPAGHLITLDLDPGHQPNVVARAEQLPIRDDSAGLIVSTEMLEHCPEPARAVQEMHRALRQGGRLILSTPFVYVVHGSPGDYFRFTADGLNHLFRSFHEVEIHPFGNRFTVVYDLLVGFTPFLSSVVNPFLSRFFAASRSPVCPAGHVIVARK